jgi:hypothetical protein
MKTPLLLLALICLSVAALRADAYSHKEPFSQTHPFNPNGTLSLENVNGSIEIRTWDRAEVKIEGERSAQTAEELKLIEMTIDPKPDHVSIQVKLPKRPGTWFGGGNIRASVRFTITVPVEARLEAVKTVNAGVTISGVRGPVHAGTVNGRIHASGLANDAKLSTVNGAIEAEFVALPAGRSVEFKSVNGEIKIALPKDAGTTVRTSVVNGQVKCDLPLQATDRVGKKNLRGIIGDGRAELTATTVNGSIRIGKT